MTTYCRAPSRWVTVALATLALVGGSLLPVPFERHPSFEGAGPDTLAHFLGYAGFAAALDEALSVEGVGWVLRAALTVGTATGIAVGTGRVQRYVPGRAHERSDVVAGVSGACIGVLWGTRGSARRRPGRIESVTSANDARRTERIPNT
ncbi:VanZ family protein [Halovivax limisalsi]|uniref:VanZ family protein n=1 Tax=Halovivax limisalsi TaxID=1453760 RepID=UPI001FFCCE0B|nr:VanZ family protein [Halovivax limisalsi]